MEVPAHIQEKCQRLWSGEVYFKWSKSKERFICMVNEKNTGLEYLLFVVQDAIGNFRPIGEPDFKRIGEAVSRNPQDEERKRQEILEQSKLRRQKAQEILKKQKEDRRAAAREITKSIETNPAIARAINLDAPRANGRKMVFHISNNPLAKDDESEKEKKPTKKAAKKSTEKPKTKRGVKKKTK